MLFPSACRKTNNPSGNQKSRYVLGRYLVRIERMYHKGTGKVPMKRLFTDQQHVPGTYPGYQRGTYHVLGTYYKYHVSTCVMYWVHTSSTNTVLVMYLVGITGTSPVLVRVCLEKVSPILSLKQFY